MTGWRICSPLPS